MRGKKNEYMRIALVTNIPSPYRVLQFNKIAEELGSNFIVLYTAKLAFNRKWKVKNIKHNHIFLKKTLLSLPNKSIYFNTDIWKQLKQIKPTIIITAGFNPTMLIAFLYSKFKKIRHIVFTDAWLQTVDSLSFFHKVIRKIIFRFSDAFICIGKKGKEYLLKYGAEKYKNNKEAFGNFNYHLGLLFMGTSEKSLSKDYFLLANQSFKEVFNKDHYVFKNIKQNLKLLEINRS